MTHRLPETENWVRSTQLSRRAAIGGTLALTSYAAAAQPVAPTAIKTSADGLDVTDVQIKTGDFMMNAYRAKPKGKGKRPTIIVVHEVFGVHEWIRDITRRFAHAGYYAIAPDLFQRAGDATKITDFSKLFNEIVGKTPDAQVMADLDALGGFVGSDGGNAGRMGITGFCWGGAITWLYAAHNPKVRAGVAWYGRLVGKPSANRPAQPIDLIPKIKRPVLGLYGGKDKGIPVADVEAMSVALAKAKSSSKMHLFPEADHGFLADYRPSYNKAAAKEGWAEALAWFKKGV